MDKNPETISILRDIRTLLSLLLAAILTGIGLRFTPFGATAYGAAVALLILYSGIGMFIWLALSRLVGWLVRLSNSDESDRR